ncbi:hypothetical protein [Natronincola ferrireducens]|uniref:Uncharacterized protein n=1 Tax=Natronincola ferrireducens TaxID=393762 RepID=A0A1G9I6H7_9FIRM|nr:hypothetical protein [Natronincola ferrireducens]SDL20819.1 hypothetical protein SAMN05660472_02812 [Natronincola ferrireducens]
MLSLERNGYSEEEVKEILHASNRQEGFRYRLLDKDEIEKGWLDTVQRSRISYSSLAKIKRSANITMIEDNTVDYLNDRIQPWIDITAMGKTVSFPMGVFLLNSPKREDDKNVIFREIEAYDKLQILEEDSFEERYFIPAGENYVNAISSIIMSAGETSIQITPTTLTTLTDKEFDLELTKLDIINKLLEELNYYSLRVDVEGNYVSEPYIEPSAKPIDYVYRTDKKSVIVAGASEDIDLYSVKNVFVVFVDNPDKPPLRSIYVNDNPNSITSTESRGRRLADVRRLEDIADQSALDSYTRRIAINATNIYSHITFPTAIMPMHDYLDTLQIQYSPLGVSDIYQETSWEIDLQVGGEMRHTVRKVVYL